MVWRFWKVFRHLASSFFGVTIIAEVFFGAPLAALAFLQFFLDGTLTVEIAIRIVVAALLCGFGWGLGAWFIIVKPALKARKQLNKNIKNRN